MSENRGKKELIFFTYRGTIALNCERPGWMGPRTQGILCTIVSIMYLVTLVWLICSDPRTYIVLGGLDGRHDSTCSASYANMVSDNL